MRRARRGFTLVEVMAAFVVAVLVILPVGAIVSSVSASFAGVQRSMERRAELQLAIAAAMALEPLRAGEFVIGEYEIEVRPRIDERTRDLRRAGWELYTLAVRRPSSSPAVLAVTVRSAQL
jgi:hypothetical protein